MSLFFLKTFGWLAAHAPESILRGISAVLGDFIFWCMPRRRRVVLSNLHHAFPEKPLSWQLATGRESCRRIIETGLLSLATPFLDVRRFREIVAVSPDLLAIFAQHQREPGATLICSPHIAYWEAQTAMPLVVPGPFPEFGIIFRPLDHPAVNEFVTTSRESFGMKLLSRKEGFAAALQILRRQGFVGVLFDQNAGLRGALTTLFGRVCSTTELPGLMAEKFDARVFGIFPRRRGFWRVEIGAKRILHDRSSDAVTIGLNRWLEDLLSSDDNLCASWLWAHDRWRHQERPSHRFRLEAKRDLLAADLQARHLAAPPRRTRIWVRLPNWLGDVVMAVPLLRALRASRPDAQITLVAQPQFLPLLEHFAVADRLHAIPPRGPGYFAHFHALRAEYPDVWLLFTRSVRGDLEAWLSGCRHRFGIVRAGQPRPLLTHAFRVPPEFDERTQHQLTLWDAFLRNFGLNHAADRSVRALPLSESPSRIGLIPGSENTPAKRWPVTHWRALIEAMHGESFEVFGTLRDQPVTRAVASGFDPDRVRDLAGKTDLPGFARALRECRAIVTNDSGGLHLANALGVPVIALFGPTNPQRTGPVFNAPVRILQPPNCPPTGGGAMSALHPQTVAGVLRDFQRDGQVAGSTANGRPAN